MSWHCLRMINSRPISFFLAISLVIACIFVSSNGFAEILSIEGQASLNSQLLANKLHLSGSYYVENRAEQSAQNVFPVFFLGHWKWEGEKRNIPAGSKTEWKIDVEIDQLLILENTESGKQGLPLLGEYPLLILIYYQDSNSYQFSAPSIETLTFGTIESNISASTIIDSELSLKQVGNNFMGQVRLQNFNSKPELVKLILHTSQELVLSRETVFVDLPANSLINLRFAMKNLHGVLGSEYPLYVGLSWEENGMRKLKLLGTTFIIARSTRNVFYLVPILFSLIISCFIFRIVIGKCK